jgi:hypothetical protein
MKAISASIVVFSGCSLFASGLFWRNEAQMLVMLLGAVVAGVGLFGWWRELSKNGPA